MKYLNRVENDKNIYTFENGVILEIGLNTSHVTYPAEGDAGSFGFPVKHPGDVFCAFLKGESIPDHCKAW
jgi:hypothetical protein